MNVDATGNGKEKWKGEAEKAKGYKGEGNGVRPACDGNDQAKEPRVLGSGGLQAAAASEILEFVWGLGARRHFRSFELSEAMLFQEF